MIRSIQIYVTSKYDERRLATFLAHIQHLKCLEIYLDKEKYMRSRAVLPNQPTDDNERAVASDELVRALFDKREVDFGSSLDREETESIAASVEAFTFSRLQLETLNLRGLDLVHAGPALLQQIDLTRLHTLIVQDCAQSYAALPTVSDEIVNLQELRTLVIAQQRSSVVGGPSIDTLNDFLSSFTGLRSIVFSSRSEIDDKPEPSAISNHSATLRYLYIDFCSDDPDYIYYDLEDLEQLCTTCRRMEQLAIPMPEFNLWCPADVCGCKQDGREFCVSVALCPCPRIPNIDMSRPR